MQLAARQQNCDSGRTQLDPCGCPQSNPEIGAIWQRRNTVVARLRCKAGRAPVVLGKAALDDLRLSHQHIHEVTALHEVEQEVQVVLVLTTAQHSTSHIKHYLATDTSHSLRTECKFERFRSISSRR